MNEDCTDVDQLGQCIEEYKIISFVKKGGFAEVYRAKCLKSGTEVAIKRIDRKRMNAAGMMNRIKQEIHIHSSLNHSSIVRLLTHFEDPNFIYIVLEYCRFGDLHQYLDANGAKVLSEEDVCYVLSQIVEGLCYLHCRRIVHRDLSLSNLLLNKHKRIKISDFGLATQIQPNVKHMTMCGTPNYISPEVASRSSHGYEADIWGLGCILYILMTGKAPFQSAAVKGTLTRVVFDDYDRAPLSNLSESAIDLIDSLLRKEPQQRLPLHQIHKHPFVLKYQANGGATTLNSAKMYDSGFKTMSSSAAAANTFDKKRRLFQNLATTTTAAMSSSSLLSSNGSQKRLFGQKITSQSQQLPSAPLQAPEYSLFRLFESSETKKSLCSILSEKRQQKDQLNARNITVTKLNTTRLQPIRRRIKNAMCSILANGEVCVEFIKKRNGNEIIDNVCRISADGMRIVIYRPDFDKRKIQDNQVVPLPKNGSDLIFSYENLPAEFLNKYIYATRFVQLVQAITAKVTYYNDKAKHVLMESGTHFESYFYDGGRVTWSTNDGIKIVDKMGDKSFSRSEDDIDSLTGSFRVLWDQANAGREHCFLVEDSLEQLQSTCNFPAVIGQKRPLTLSKNGNVESERISNKENKQPSCTSHNNVSKKQSIANGNTEVEVPGIGFASCSNHNRGINVRYFDGSRLLLTDRNLIEYHTRNGETNTYTMTDTIPKELASKLRNIDVIVKHLKRAKISTKK